MAPSTNPIDEIDTCILRELLGDARKSFVDIAITIGVSKNTVRNRFAEMTKAKIIVGATAQINYKRLGYDCVAALLLEVEPAQLESVSKQLEEIPDVFGPFKSTSRINLRAVVTLKSMFELESIKEKLRKKIAVKEIGTNIWTDVWFLPENLSLIYSRQTDLSTIDKNLNCQKKDYTINADELDLQLIRELTKDSRISFRKLAKKLGTSTETIARRYENLKKTGTVIARIQIDPKKIGYQGTGHFYLKLAGECNFSIINQIIKIPDIFYIMKSVGDYNIGVMLLVKSTEDMLRTGDLLSQLPGVKKIESTVQRLPDEWPIPRTYTSTT
jgi:DNA-binding Lrp family transcriptional regulator